MVLLRQATALPSPPAVGFAISRERSGVLARWPMTSSALLGADLAVCSSGGRGSGESSSSLQRVGLWPQELLPSHTAPCAQARSRVESLVVLFSRTQTHGRHLLISDRDEQLTLVPQRLWHSSHAS